MKPLPAPESLLCPSYVAKPGAQLLGIVGANGRVSFLKTPIRIDATFVDEARRGRPAEERFRFAGKCIQNGCHQWNNERGLCSLTDRLIARIGQPANGPVPDCPIQSRCRWFAQRGRLACANCDEVIRHTETASLDRLAAPV